VITIPSRRTFIDSLLLAGLAPALGSCIRPPGATPGGATSASPSTATGVAATASAPREFSHTSTELLGSLRLGWNVGNSLDVPDGETAWGNPKVTPELLATVAKLGFKLVRIPVTWASHTGPGPDFTIDPAWLQRTSEVVGYAHAAGLYAVINVHHDGADGFKGPEWLTLNDAEGKTTDANNAAVRARFVAVWAQIARHFVNFGEELLFESMNEIHDGYGNPDPRHFTFINDLNQHFVDLVRRSGGNNAKRHLIVPGYNTNIDHTVAGFEPPKDPTPARLSLSVHFYDPYTFALVAKTQTWGDASPGHDNWGQESHVTAQFDKLKTRFIDQGLPVFLGEYGATNQTGFEDYRRYYVEYVTKAAVDRGMLPVYWDNGGTNDGKESFALINRASGQVQHPELLEAMLRAANGSGKLSDVKPPKPAP
jgi:endoglucanase